jgi:hypothetical protein
MADRLWAADRTDGAERHTCSDPTAQDTAPTDAQATTATREVSHSEADARRSPHRLHPTANPTANRTAQQSDAAAEYGARPHCARLCCLALFLNQLGGALGGALRRHLVLQLFEKSPHRFAASGRSAVARYCTVTSCSGCCCTCSSAVRAVAPGRRCGRAGRSATSTRPACLRCSGRDSGAVCAAAAGPAAALPSGVRPLCVGLGTAHLCFEVFAAHM